MKLTKLNDGEKHGEHYRFNNYVISETKART